MRRPSLPRRTRRPLLALTVPTLALALALPLLAGPAPAEPPGPRAELSLPPIPAVPGLPIVSLPTDLLVPRFVGAPAKPGSTDELGR
ncbi:hypothetical protein J2S59_001275 [Nocardioides massiliensis]|uniref:Uncharacterized protein n=1 Tax=Nocardioides massiliensis TaxID=1325935 RepID=A0ABT9NM18_9ACTN|nr:hypothetical protein [Nocardioides massiliensis]MDP9821466.1 hypothetical protein [Nocardioides massiliensis]